jgi:uncharacterized protein (TIGR02246 family)
MRYILGILIAATTIMAASDEAVIRKLLSDQEQAWNRGDIEEFVSSYEKSPLITLVGKTVSRGYDGVLSRYRRDYPDKLHMGTLHFEEIEVKMLGKEHALIIGKFILERSEPGGGPASGRYSLIARKLKDGWKIIHDHTSN